MATFNKFDQFVADRSNGVHNLGSDVLKFALTNTLPVKTDSVIADITQLSGS